MGKKFNLKQPLEGTKLNDGKIQNDMVYVDDMNAPYGRMIMCHMIADTTEELLDMADKIGLNIKWIQKAGTYQEHFDVSKGYKVKAIGFGAKEIGMRELSKMTMNKDNSPLKGFFK